MSHAHKTLVSHPTIFLRACVEGSLQIVYRVRRGGDPVANVTTAQAGALLSLPA
jgi:hypothetical protein